MSISKAKPTSPLSNTISLSSDSSAVHKPKISKLFVMALFEPLLCPQLKHSFPDNAQRKPQWKLCCSLICSERNSGCCGPCWIFSIEWLHSITSYSHLLGLSGALIFCSQMHIMSCMNNKLIFWNCFFLLFSLLWGVLGVRLRFYSWFPVINLAYLMKSWQRF